MDNRSGHRRQIAGTVSRTHLNHDVDLTDLTVRDGTGRVSVLHTTDHHRFWIDADHQWVEAGDLAAGTRLHTPDGDTVAVSQIRSYAGAQDMYDLTVEGVHTYYVVAGNLPVLVHNTSTDDCSDAAYQGALHIIDEFERGNLNHAIPGVDMKSEKAVDQIATYLDRIMSTTGRSVQSGKSAWYDPNTEIMILRKNEYSATARQMTTSKWNEWLAANAD